MWQLNLNEFDDEERPKLKYWIFLASLLLLIGIGFRYWRERQLIRSEFLTSLDTQQTADCGVVLTGSAGRIREGFDLIEQGRIQKLIISGVNEKTTLKDLLPLWPYYPKVTESSVFLEKRSETTYGNALQSLPVVQALQCRDMMLITSELHMYRAFQVFRPVYPENFFIYKHSVLSPRGRYSVFDEFVEVIKSLFYRPWAYAG